MKSNLVVMGALAGAFLSSIATPSSAAVDRTTFRGENASASFFTESALVCDDGSSGFLSTSVFLDAFENVVRSTFGNSRGEGLFVSFFEFNSCTGEFASAFQFVENPDYDQTKVDSASLAGTFNLVDDVTGSAIGTLVVDLDLTGTGATARSNSHSSFRSGDFFFQSRSQGTFRSATASGTVNLDGVELVGSSQFAQLSDTRSGDMQVTH